jgi:hypothetical protein
METNRFKKEVARNSHQSHCHEVGDFLLAADDAYAMLLGVCIVSLLKNNSQFDKINVHIIDGGISPTNLALINQIFSDYPNAQRHYYPAGPYLALAKELKVPAWKENYMSYVPLFAIPDIKVSGHLLVYLDCDSIVEKSLLPLYRIPDRQHAIWAVPYPLRDKKFYKRFGFNRFEYFSSGMWVINFRAWTENHFQQILSIRNQTDQKFIQDFDEGILNWIATSGGGNYLKLGYQYLFLENFLFLDSYLFLRLSGVNKTLSKQIFKEIESASQQVSIYAMNRSPRGAVFESGEYINPQYGEIWKKYYKISPWKNQPLPPPRPTTLLAKISAVLYRRAPRKLYTLFSYIAYKLMS